MRRRIVALTFSCCVAACGSDPSPESRTFVSPTTIDAAVPEPDGGLGVPLDGAAPRECRVALADGTACECHEVGQRPPTLYLLLDRSGSMGDKPPRSTRSKWSLVKSALVDRERGVLRRLGTRISIAMAWFPSPASEDACDPGRQVLPAQWGGGAVYDALEAKLTSAVPRGSTPTAASLRSLVDVIAALPKPAYVLLATDGAPTCGDTRCSVDACTYNLEKQAVGFVACDASTNCCDPANTSDGIGWKACADVDATVAATRAVAEAGAKVFVLGVPGTIAAYDSALDAIAAAGGAAPRYYAATEPTQDALENALSSIAAQVIDTCTITLDAPVESPGVTNVLFDGELIAQDPIDGWRWTSPSTIEVSGDACARIHEGRVTRIQVAVGCLTVTR